MKLSYQDYETLTVVTLSGEFTHDDAPHFERVANERMAAGCRHLAIDCENLEFIDSRGLETLLRLQERMGAAGGQVRLVNPDDTVKNILRLTRLDLALETHQSLELAVRSMR